MYKCLTTILESSPKIRIFLNLLTIAIGSFQVLGTDSNPFPCLIFMICVAFIDFIPSCLGTSKRFGATTMLGINIMKVSAIIWLSSDGATSYCEECPTDLSSDIILAITTIIISFSMILGLYEAIRMLTNNNGDRQESE